MSNEVVSIITPCYNAASTLAKTILSVLSQTYSKWELIIVDDCSVDKSFKIAQQFAEDNDRIRCFKTKINSGAAVARNIGIEKAQGRFIAFLDADDLWDSQKLEIQLRFMIDKDVAFTYTDYFVFSEKNKKITKYIPHKDRVNYQQLLRNNCIGCLTAIYDTKKIGKIYMPVLAVKREDFACWLSILKIVDYAYKCPKLLATYHILSGSVSSLKTKMMKYQWRLYRTVEQLSFFKSLSSIVCYIINKLFRKY